MDNGLTGSFSLGAPGCPPLRTWDAGSAPELLQLQGTAVTAAANAIVITDRSGLIVWVNPAFSTLTGYDAAEAVGRNPRDLLKSGRQDREAYQRLWATILSGRTWRGELLNRRKDGSIYPEYQTITPVCDASYRITHFIAIKQDLTEARQATAALREAEMRYRTLFDQSPDGIVIVDVETGILLEFNEAAHRQLGYSREEFAGLRIADLEAAETAEETRRRIAAVMRDGRQDFETYHRTRQGQLRNIQVTAQYTRAHGRPVYHCVWRDVTESRAAERRLREQNEILANSDEGVMIVSLAGEIRLWNRGAEKIFGWTAAEALGRKPEELLGHDPSLIARLRQEVGREGAGQRELPSHTRDGRALTVSARTTLVRDEAGRPLARLTFLADVTEKHELEAKFLQAQRLENIGTLAAGVAHDLNNVLAPIVFAAPLLRGSLSAPRDLKVLEILEQSAARGTGLVKQILGFSRGTSGGFQPTQLKHLIRDVLAIIQETFPKSIRAEHHLPADLWPVQGDPTQLHQVLLNLCVNARDAMPRGGTLALSAVNLGAPGTPGAIPGGRPGSWIRLEIADTGTGIAPGIRERIWAPFFTTKEPGQGTGLGLSTVRGIVASHQGFIELESEVGRGTTFRIFLPAIDAPAPGPVAPAGPLPPAGRGELILVVDDDPAIRDLIAAILTRHGYRVVCARDGAEALALCQAPPGEIALVLTDVDMPNLGGLALARALRELRSALPILAMSGLSRADSGVAGLPESRGLTTAFLPKPFDDRDLLAAVAGCLPPAAAGPVLPAG